MKKEKKPPLGSGERFANLTEKLQKRGAKNPEALSAWIMRKKYGPKKSIALSKQGKKDASKHNPY